MKKSKTLAAAALTGAIAGGALFGTVLGSPLTSGAQDNTEAEADAEPRGNRGRHLEAAAEALGMSTEDLRAALQEDQTLAQVAEAQGVDVQTVIDALVADATERINQRVADGDLTQEEADQRLSELTERVTTRVNEGRQEGDGPRGRRGPKLEATAEALGVSVEDLRAALQDGQTIADVAEANGVDVQTVIDAQVAAATERIDQAVADGKITQEEADEKLSELTERITTRVNEGRPEGEGPRGPRGPQADDAEEAPEGN